MPIKSKHTSRCLNSIYQILQSEVAEGVSKYKAAHRAHCDQRTAARILMHLHIEKHIHIIDWLVSKGAWIPVYRIGQGSDVPRTPILTSNRRVYQRKRRENIVVRTKEAEAKRLKRSLENVPTFGFWGI